MASPIAFVLMPFGQKKDALTGKTIDFDDVFARLIAPGIEAASMVPLRGDLETSLGIIHKRFFEKLMLCEFAVADLTTSNANVFYEFGVRHAIRPRTTLALSAHPENLPFDVAPLSVVPYQLDARGSLVDAAVAGTVAAIAEKLHAAKADVRARPIDRPDSPLFSLITGYRAPDLAHLRADVFPERVADEVAVAERIAAIRARALASDPDDNAARQDAFAKATAALDAIRAELGDLDDERTDVLTKLMLAYRAISAWDRMVTLIEEFPAPLNRQTLPREQLGMALNRIAESKEKVKDPDAAVYAERALSVLTKLEHERGTNPETSSLIGRVHKSRWLSAVDRNDRGAPSHLRRAIDAYRRGFEADWRDTYPGINLLTLLFALGNAGRSEFTELLPVVRYGVRQRVRLAPDDYWQHATLLELAVLEGDETAADEHLADALARRSEEFQGKTTSDNLGIIMRTAPDPDALAFVASIRRALWSFGQ